MMRSQVDRSARSRGGEDRAPSASRTRRSVSFASSCSSRQAMTTSAPSRAYASATARPMPLSAPVTSATTIRQPAIPAVALLSVVGLLAHLRLVSGRPLRCLAERRTSSPEPSGRGAWRVSCDAMNQERCRPTQLVREEVMEHLPGDHGSRAARTGARRRASATSSSHAHCARRSPR